MNPTQITRTQPSRPSTADRRHHSPRLSRSGLLGAGGLLTVALLAGCAGASEPAPESSTSQANAAASSSAAQAGSALTVTDPWVKTTDEGMTGVFATLENTSDQPLHLVGASSEAAGTAELHETAEDGTGSTVMQEKEGGFVIGPGQSLELVPGGDHIMLMRLHQEIEPGQQIHVDLEFADGTTAALDAVAKEYAGANEVYDADEDHSGHSDHSGSASEDAERDGH